MQQATGKLHRKGSWKYEDVKDQNLFEMKKRKIVLKITMNWMWRMVHTQLKLKKLLEVLHKRFA